MRIDVKKFLFLGLEEDRRELFSKAQEAGIVHFIDSNPKKIKEISTIDPNFELALKVLRGLPVVEQVETTDYSQADEIVTTIADLHQRLEALNEEARTLRLEISRIAVFGDFSLEDIRYIEKEGGRKIQFFCAKRHSSEPLLSEEGLIYIDTQYDLDYFIAINKEPRQYPGMIEMQIDLPVGLVQQRVVEVKEEIQFLEKRIKEFAKYHRFLHKALLVKWNHENYQTACHFPRLELEGRLFAVEGWVPSNKIAELRELVGVTRIFADEVAIEPEDVIPTYLQNKGAGRIGEDLVHIYDTPAYNDKDPSLWVLGFFALFFAMIVGDAGYGSVYLGIALYLRYRYPNLRGAAKRVLNLATILALSVMTWGLLTNSFFSMSLDLHHPIRKFSLVHWLVEMKANYHLKNQDQVYQQWVDKFPEAAQARNGLEFLDLAAKRESGEIQYEALGKFADNVMMELVLVIAIIHLILSLLRYLPRRWPSIGWVIFLIGCYLYFPFYLGVVSMAQYLAGIDRVAAGASGEQMIYLGLFLAFFLGILQAGIYGLLEIMNLLQVFADVLSYLRLYALGIAGAIVAATINDLARTLPIVFAVVIIVIGHVINMVLGIMGGVIHGLRLNFLEWYHYSFDGGGKRFKPLNLYELE